MAAARTRTAGRSSARRWTSAPTTRTPRASRPFAAGISSSAPGRAVDYTRRIYKASADTQLLDIEKWINNTRRKFVVDPEPKTFTSLETAVRALIAREEHEFDAAGQPQELGARPPCASRPRERSTLEVQILATSIAKMAHRRVEADLAKFKFRQDPVMQVSLGRRIDDMGQVIAILAKTAWLDELAAEAAARAEADGRGVEPDVVVPDVVVPDVRGRRLTLRGSGGRPARPTRSVASAALRQLALPLGAGAVEGLRVEDLRR